MNIATTQGLLDGLFHSLSSPLVATIIGLAIVTIGVGFLIRGVSHDIRPRYIRTPRLLSDNEIDFAGQLRAICPPDLMICPQVAIAALVDVAEHVTEPRGARNAYAQCYADFVLCRAETFEIVGIIEVDDRTHGQAHRRKRDERLDAIYKSIGLPVAHVIAKKTGRYTARDAEVAIDAIRHQQRA